jgi:hypothetical protein
MSHQPYPKSMAPAEFRRIGDALLCHAHNSGSGFFTDELKGHAAAHRY